MARIRTVKPEFFRHEGLYELERSTGLPVRLAFAGLWTAADREGRFRWQPRALKLDCLPYDDVDFSAVLEAMRKGGIVQKYVIDGTSYGFIPSWEKHQHINQREAQSAIPAPSNESIVDDGARTCNEEPSPVSARGEGKGRERKGKEEERKEKDATANAAHVNEVSAQRAPHLVFEQPTPEVELFRRGKEVLGDKAGGLISKLVKAKNNSIPLARSVIETAVTKQNPREYVSRIINNQQTGPPTGDYGDPRL